MKTLSSIQALRAIAACAVALAHIQGDVNHHMGVSLLPLLSVGAVGVDIFFVISGFIMVYVSAPMFAAPGAARVFLLRRICRIVPLYWAVTTLYIVIWLWALGRGALPAFDWTLASYLFIPYPGGNETFPVYSIGWTLNYEMFFYAVFAITLFWSRRGAVAVLAGAFLLWVAAGSLLDLPAPAKFLANSIVLEFVGGALLGLAYVEGYRVSRLVGSLMVTLAVALLAWGFSVDYLPFLIAPVWPPRFVGLGVPAFLIVAGAALQEPHARPGALTRLLEQFGDASYAIYLLHPMVFVLARLGWSNVRGGTRIADPTWLDVLATSIYAALTFGLALALSAIVYKTYERPVTRFLTRQLVGTRKANRERGGAGVAVQPDLAPTVPLKE
jgi:exopolysaccharide production protein ExoZ